MPIMGAESKDFEQIPRGQSRRKSLPAGKTTVSLSASTVDTASFRLETSSGILEEGFLSPKQLITLHIDGPTEMTVENTSHSDNSTIYLAVNPGE